MQRLSAFLYSMGQRGYTPSPPFPCPLPLPATGVAQASGDNGGLASPKAAVPDWEGWEGNLLIAPLLQGPGCGQQTRTAAGPGAPSLESVDQEERGGAGGQAASVPLQAGAAEKAAEIEPGG